MTAPEADQDDDDVVVGLAPDGRMSQGGTQESVRLPFRRPAARDPQAPAEAKPDEPG